MENSIVQNKVTKIPTSKVLPNKFQGEKEMAVKQQRTYRHSTLNIHG